jgi:hypothetical protein
VHRRLLHHVPDVSKALGFVGRVLRSAVCLRLRRVSPGFDKLAVPHRTALSAASAPANRPASLHRCTLHSCSVRGRHDNHPPRPLRKDLPSCDGPPYFAGNVGYVEMFLGPGGGWIEMIVAINASFTVSRCCLNRHSPRCMVSEQLHPTSALTPAVEPAVRLETAQAGSPRAHRTQSFGRAQHGRSYLSEEGSTLGNRR